MQGRTPLAAAVEQGKGHAALLLQTLGTKNDRFYTTTIVFVCRHFENDHFTKTGARTTNAGRNLLQKRTNATVYAGANVDHFCINGQARNIPRSCRFAVLKTPPFYQDRLGTNILR